MYKESFLLRCDTSITITSIRRKTGVNFLIHQSETGRKTPKLLIRNWVVQDATHFALPQNQKKYHKGLLWLSGHNSCRDLAPLSQRHYMGKDRWTRRGMAFCIHQGGIVRRDWQLLPASGRMTEQQPQFPIHQATSASWRKREQWTPTSSCKHTCWEHAPTHPCLPADRRAATHPVSPFTLQETKAPICSSCNTAPLGAVQGISLAPSKTGLQGFVFEFGAWQAQQHQHCYFL